MTALASCLPCNMTPFITRTLVSIQHEQHHSVHASHANHIHFCSLAEETFLHEFCIRHQPVSHGDGDATRFPHVSSARNSGSASTILKSHPIEGGTLIERLRRAIRFKAEPKKSQKWAGRASGEEFLKPVAGVGTGFRDRHVEVGGVPVPHQAKAYSPGRFGEMAAHVVQHVAAGNQV